MSDSIFSPPIANADPLTQPSPKMDFSKVKSREEAERVAAEFEAVFIAQMLKPMFEDIGTDGLFGGGSAERAFRPLLVDEYAKSFASQGGIGLKDTLVREILSLQGLE